MGEQEAGAGDVSQGWRAVVGRGQLSARAYGAVDLPVLVPASTLRHAPLARFCPAASHGVSAWPWALAVDPAWCCFPTLRNSLGFLLLLCSAGRQTRASSGCCKAWVCAGSWQSFLAACVPGVPCGDPLLRRLP